jgi:hypothetical protein
MNKLNISINLLALQGVCKATIKGEECLVIRLDKSRAKVHQNGKIYLNLEAVANKDGKDQYGNTHFIVEPTSREEREGGLKLPIIGNGKVCEPKGSQPRQERQQTGNAARYEQEHESMDDSEIPF